VDSIQAFTGMMNTLRIASISQSGVVVETRLLCSSLFGTSLSSFGVPCLDVSLSVHDETALLGQPNDKPDSQDCCGVWNRVFHLRGGNDLK
jgi:hypothetical protein